MDCLLQKELWSRRPFCPHKCLGEDTGRTTEKVPGAVPIFIPEPAVKLTHVVCCTKVRGSPGSIPRCNNLPSYTVTNLVLFLSSSECSLFCKKIVIISFLRIPAGPQASRDTYDQDSTKEKIISGDPAIQLSARSLQKSRFPGWQSPRRLPSQMQHWTMRNNRGGQQQAT